MNYAILHSTTLSLSVRLPLVNYIYGESLLERVICMKSHPLFVCLVSDLCEAHITVCTYAPFYHVL